MTLPYAEPLTVRQPGARVVPEPPRRGESGGEPCGVCGGASTTAVWADEHFTMHPPVQCALPGTVWIASKVHADSFCDLPADVAAASGSMVARVEKAMLAALDDVGRVHLYRWGDGGAHFHVWLMPRPLGMLEANGPHLPIWEDVLPNVADEDCVRAAKQIARALDEPS
jgi:diadenosine tetraphosphate (Ap4A) HIT family hydrolase